MENKKYYSMLAERAAEIAKDPHIAKQTKKRYLEGQSLDDIKGWIYLLAAATLHDTREAGK